MVDSTIVTDILTTAPVNLYDIILKSFDDCKDLKMHLDWKHLLVLRKSALRLIVKHCNIGRITSDVKSSN